MHSSPRPGRGATGGPLALLPGEVRLTARAGETLLVTQALLDGLVSAARAEAPEEVCGWLAGKDNRAVRDYPVPNAAEDLHCSFRMEPEAQLSSMRGIRDSGLELTATYHSHPRTPAEPSLRDLQLAAYPDSFHLIVSLSGDRPEVRCYRITEEGCRPVALLVE